jgi:hypothetical protein
MKSITPKKYSHAIATLLLCLVMSGCEYETPITQMPTREVDVRLVGHWLAMEGWMKVRQLDSSGYVVFHDGKLYRAWHSTVAGLPLLSVQDIESERRTFAYLHYALSEDGRRLTLRVVNDKLIPDDTKGPDRVKSLFEAHAHDPALFGPPFVYLRQ